MFADGLSFLLFLQPFLFPTIAAAPGTAGAPLPPPSISVGKMNEWDGFHNMNQHVFFCLNALTCRTWTWCTISTSVFCAYFSRSNWYDGVGRGWEREWVNPYAFAISFSDSISFVWLARGSAVLHPPPVPTFQGATGMMEWEVLACLCWRVIFHFVPASLSIPNIAAPGATGVPPQAAPVTEAQPGMLQASLLSFFFCVST